MPSPCTKDSSDPRDTTVENTWLLPSKCPRPSVKPFLPASVESELLLFSVFKTLSALTYLTIDNIKHIYVASIAKIRTLAS